MTSYWFFSAAVGSGSESCSHWVGIPCLWKSLGAGAEKRQCSGKGSELTCEDLLKEMADSTRVGTILGNTEENSPANVN